MVIRIKDHIGQCYSAADGAVIAQLIGDSLARDEPVRLSFVGITDVTSSFINSAIVSFLKRYPVDWIKGHVSISDVTVPTSDLIRRCLANGERNISNYQ